MSSPSNTTTTPTNDTTPDASGWSANLYNRVANFVYSSKFTTPILELLNAKPGERIIDFGCGSGELSLEIERIVEQGQGGIVVGVDASESMIAKSESNGLKHAFVADLQDPLTLVFPPLTTGSEQEQDKFDAVFSNAALHWCKRDPNAVIENAKRVLKKGGRFVGEMGGYMNCVGVRSALHTVLKRRGYSPVELDPWYFPHDSEYKKLLESHGFQVQSCTLHPRITPVPAGLRGWLDLFVSNSWLKGLKGEEADKILKEVEDMCRVDLFYGGNGLGDGEKKEEDGKEGKEDKDEGGWGLMYVRLRFVATLA